MPVYEYECVTCGVFSVLRKMNESSQPAPCEECGCESPRIMSVPRLAVLGKVQRLAHERNERSAHEPKLGRRSSCGCTGSHTCKTSSESSNSGKKSFTKNAEGNSQPFQMQTKKTARPWMLGH